MDVQGIHEFDGDVIRLLMEIDKSMTSQIHLLILLSMTIGLLFRLWIFYSGESHLA